MRKQALQGFVEHREEQSIIKHNDDYGCKSLTGYSEDMILIIGKNDRCCG